MKLTYSGNFSFSCLSKQGTFEVNSASVDEGVIFAISTSAQRDMNAQGRHITWPGEYEFGGGAVQTFLMANDELGAKVVNEGVRILFLPTLTKDLSEEKMEVFGNVDVLVCSVSEMNSEVKKIIEEIDARALVVVGSGQEKVFAEMGAGALESQKEFVFSKSSLPSDRTELVKFEVV